VLLAILQNPSVNIIYSPSHEYDFLTASWNREHESSKLRLSLVNETPQSFLRASVVFEIGSEESAYHGI
jgi:hypothetical protein